MNYLMNLFYLSLGNNPVTVCENCAGDINTYCTSNDPFADYNGAFNCMASRVGDVAFVRHTTIAQGTANSTASPTVCQQF